MGSLREQEMGTLNPYQPPSGSVPSSNADSFQQDGIQPRLLPRSFWTVWAGFSVICVVFVAVVFYLGRVDRSALSFIGPPLLGLWLSPFVVVRAKLCERYQHRCVGSSGIVIFLACLGVCFGLGYASLGITFALWALLSTFMIGNQQSLTGFQQVLLAGLLITAVVVYLKLIDLSAKRPKLKQEVVSS
jgi:hypothetical protein